MKKVGETKGFTIGIIQFPGSNCDQDCYLSLQRHFEVGVSYIWHRETKLPKVDALVLPGGFSYGDYLRAGALAARSPIVKAVSSFVESGGPVIGICNGFQILTETKILPGTLLQNDSTEFKCLHSSLKINENAVSWRKQKISAEFLKIPIAHGEGRYYSDESTLEALKDNGQIYFKYLDNPNGSLENIAGISSKDGRVIGMMPHPERACDPEVASDDGLIIWKNFLENACG